MLRNLLSDPNIPKIGLEPSYENEKIKRKYNLSIDGFVNLQVLSKMHFDEPKSLSTLYEMCFGEPLKKKKSLKTITLSNWESTILSESQIKYAAADAIATREILLKFYQLSRNSYHKTSETPSGSFVQNAPVDLSETQNVIDWIVEQKLQK